VTLEQLARDAIAANPAWYHSIELAPGIVTPGVVDLRRVARRLLPDDLRGRRALDVGTFDGFWAFEMERRGAEVVAIDVEAIESAEWPPLSRPRLERESRELGVELGTGFRLAAGCLGSAVQRVVCPVYELDAESIGGAVDFAFSGAILLHLRDPVRALERVREVLPAGAELRLYEPVSIWLSLSARRRPAASFQAAAGEFNWWVPNLAGLAAYLRAASFEQIRRLAVFRPPSTARMRQYYAAMRATA
jgi:tRNA (mo5U34)-methyltransferase